MLCTTSSFRDYNGQTHYSLQVDNFSVYLCSQDMLVGLVAMTTYCAGICFFRSASIFAYVTEDRHSSLRMGVMEDLNMHAGYYNKRDAVTQVAIQQYF